LFEGVLECVAAGIVPGAIERNRESSQDAVIAGPGVTPAMLDVLFDAQTSGGLLIALPEPAAVQLVKCLSEPATVSPVPCDTIDAHAVAIIGRVLQPGTGRIHVRTTGERPTPVLRQQVDAVLPVRTKTSCCRPARNKRLLLPGRLPP